MKTNIMVPEGLSIKSGPVKKRVPRRPAHPFHIKHEAFQIQPFCIAPVLAGETLKNFTFQSRAVTDPVKNRLTGWWLEHYFFYVKLSDIFGEREDDFGVGDQTDLDDLLMDMNVDHTSLGVYEATGYDEYYSSSNTGGGMAYLKKATQLITKYYFRDEGETVTSPTLTGSLAPLAKINGTNVWDSLIAGATIEEDTLASGELPIDLSDLEAKMQTWEYMRSVQLTDMGFEEYLESFGVKLPSQEIPGKPELLRFARNWQYPSNTVDPSDGSATTAVSWSVQERGDKDRFFKEPGFIIGVTVARPKVYLSKQEGHMAEFMTGPFDWMPAIMKDQVSTSLKEFAANTGPLAATFTADSYWIDLRDLFVHGDQFVNVPLTDTDQALVALPTTDGSNKYPSEADIDALFVTAGGGDIEQDGVVNFNILGTQIDHT